MTAANGLTIAELAIAGAVATCAHGLHGKRKVAQLAPAGFLLSLTKPSPTARGAEAEQRALNALTASYAAQGADWQFDKYDYEEVDFCRAVWRVLAV